MLCYNMLQYFACSMHWDCIGQDCPAQPNVYGVNGPLGVEFVKQLLNVYCRNSY